MKKTVLLFILVFVGIQMSAQPQPEDYFITTWKPLWAGQSIVIPTFPGETYNYDVDWGDSTPVQTFITDTPPQHIYNSTNTFTVKISGTFPRFYNNNVSGSRLQSIKQWGTGVWTSMANSFSGCTSLVSVNVPDTPNLSMVTDMSNMFRGAYAFNGYIKNWNVSGVTNMEAMFWEARVFNQDIGDWDVSSVTNMKNLFKQAPLFNQDIGGWDVSSVTNMEDIFMQATVFNQNLGGWDVSNVSSGINVQLSGLTAANYDAMLIGWSTLTLTSGVVLSASGIPWCNSAAAKASIIAQGWSIINNSPSNCLGPCASETTYTGTWNNGVPTNTKRAIFAANYTTSGNIDACSIEIKSGFTVTVSPGTTIKSLNDIAINGNLIFESNATGNGELGKLGPKAAITGKATVQRYLEAHRSYRMLSPAVTTTTNINTNWQEGQHNTTTIFSQNQNNTPGFGTHITGSLTGANGFDATNTGNASMFTANVATQKFVAIGNTDVNTLTAGEAYLILVRGDRGIDMGTNNPPATVTRLRATGKLVWGNKTQRSYSPSIGAYVMFGNPYQSAVNVSTVLGSSTNVNTNQYYVYDPTLGDTGAYVTVVYSLSPNGVGGTNTSNSAANKFLQPGQGGQVSTISAGPVSVEFHEADKSSGNFTSTNVTGNTMVADGMLVGQLYTFDNYNNGGPVHDSFGILFADGKTNALTLEDASKPFNFGENLGIDHNGTYLSFEKRALPESGETFPLFSDGYNHTNYVLKMELNGLTNVAIYLEDHFTGASTLLEQGIIAHSFSVDSTNPASLATDRFNLKVGIKLNVEENEALSGITLFPNPMRDRVTLSNPNNLQLDTASIYDLTGRLIKTVDLSGMTSEMILDVSSLSSTTYIVVINSENGKISKLMVKE